MTNSLHFSILAKRLLLESKGKLFPHPVGAFCTMPNHPKCKIITKINLFGTPAKTISKSMILLWEFVSPYPRGASMHLAPLPPPRQCRCASCPMCTLWLCHVGEMALPCSATALVWHWHCHGTAMALPWQCHGTVVGLQGQYGMAVPFPCYGTATAEP